MGDDDIELAERAAGDLDRIRHFEKVREGPGFDAMRWEIDDDTSVTILCEPGRAPTILTRCSGPSVNQESRV